MFKVEHKKIRRCTLLCFALLQIALGPATYELHICCHHETFPNDQSGRPKCECSCVHHNDHGPSHDESAPEEPHDRHSCRICQAAFAISLTFVEVPILQGVETVSVLRQPDFLPPDSLAEYHSLGRGPPASGSVS